MQQRLDASTNPSGSRSAKPHLDELDPLHDPLAGYVVEVGLVEVAHLVLGLREARQDELLIGIPLVAASAALAMAFRGPRGTPGAVQADATT